MSQKIVIAEDEVGIREIMKVKLESAGFTVFAASTGKEALDLVLKQHPDVIITDIIMPEMDGFAFFKELKKNNLTSKIPVLILTAHSKMEDTFRAFGAKHFLIKPCPLDTIVAKARSFVEELDEPDSLENLDLEGEILIAGSYEQIVYFMERQLKNAGARVQAISSSKDIKTILKNMKPNLFFLDAELDSKSIKHVLDDIGPVEDVRILIFTCHKDRQSQKGAILDRLLMQQYPSPFKEKKSGVYFFGAIDRDTFAHQFNKLSQE